MLEVCLALVWLCSSSAVVKWPSGLRHRSDWKETCAAYHLCQEVYAESRVLILARTVTCERLDCIFFSEPRHGVNLCVNVL